KTEKPPAEKKEAPPEKPAAPAETAPKSEVITERDLHALTWDTIERPYKETQGVGKYNGLAWRKRKYHAVDEQGIEHEYTVRIRNDGEIEVTKGEKTREQRRKEYAQAYEQFPQQLRRAIDKEWPNLVDAQKIIIAQMATGQKYDKVFAKV